MKRKKILVFGYFGYTTNQLDGQTVKTRAVYELIKQKADADVKFADSQEFRGSIISIIRFFKDVVRCHKLVILPCLNNLRIIFPVLFVLSKFARFDIIHIGIGGWHKEYLTQWPIVRRMLKRIKINLLENTITCQELQDSFGFENVGIIPNFRTHNLMPMTRVKSNRLRLVFLARINVKKGLDTLAQVAKKLTEMQITERITLTLFGSCDSIEDKHYLEENLIDKFDWIYYGGCLEPSQINATLNGYDIMLFPTHYYTEGFPGSILDAYNAGIPVIATKWKHAQQFIQDGQTGYLVDFQNPVKEIVTRILFCLNNPQKLYVMQKEAYAESQKYSAQEAWRILKNYIE